LNFVYVSVVVTVVLLACQDGTAAVTKQSKKAKKDVPASQYPSEVN